MTEIILPNSDDFYLDGLRLRSPAQANRSVWTGRRKVVGLTGAETWTGKAAIDLVTTEEQERPWRAFLFSLRGPVNWFRWKLPCASHIGPRPVVGGSPGAAYTLPLTGGQPNARILRAGQFISVPLPSGHVRAVCLTADLRFDSLGNAEAQFEPALNETPTVGAEVETVNPYIPMALVNAEQGFDLMDGVSGASFDVEEAMGYLGAPRIPTFDDTTGDFTFDMDT